MLRLRLGSSGRGLAFAAMEPLSVDGKFFRSGGSRVDLRAVTYGPFPGGWPEDFTVDFERIAAAGFNALRLYEMPPRACSMPPWTDGLRVFGGLRWPQAVDFLKDDRILSAARISLAEALREVEGHPALAGVFVANEVPADLVRWMGPVRVRRAIEGLISLGKELRPDILWCYANYPSTEYLEPENADFTAFNVYLEDEDRLPQVSAPPPPHRRRPAAGDLRVRARFPPQRRRDDRRKFWPGRFGRPRGRARRA